MSAKGTLTVPVLSLKVETPKSVEVAGRVTTAPTVTTIKALAALSLALYKIVAAGADKSGTMADIIDRCDDMFIGKKGVFNQMDKAYTSVASLLHDAGDALGLDDTQKKYLASTFVPSTSPAPVNASGLGNNALEIDDITDNASDTAAQQAVADSDSGRW